MPYQFGVVENQSTPHLLPTYAGSPSDTNSFSKYLPPQDGAITHSDEPGIDKVILCYSNSSLPNLMVVPAMNTCGIRNNLPQVLYTNRTDFANAQIVGLGAGRYYDGGLAYAFGRIGTKNHSANALQQSGTNFWAAAGN